MFDSSIKSLLFKNMNLFFLMELSRLDVQQHVFLFSSVFVCNNTTNRVMYSSIDFTNDAYDKLSECRRVCIVLRNENNRKMSIILYIKVTIADNYINISN